MENEIIIQADIYIAERIIEFEVDSKRFSFFKELTTKFQRSSLQATCITHGH